MPIYEYQCSACGHHFESIQSFKDEALIHCPKCGEPTLKKLISAPAFHLKGTGWYATDFKNPPKPSMESGAVKETVSSDKTKASEASDASKKVAPSDAKCEPALQKKSDKTDNK